MKTNRAFTFAFLLTLFAASNFVSGCKEEGTAQPISDTKSITANNSTDTINCTCIINPSAEISIEEADMLKYMREEEKLARDVYTTLSAQYSVPVFANIAKSEQRHMDRVLCLLKYYNIDDPASAEIGIFNNQDLQELYNSLIAQGSTSLINALTVGATIEDADIHDLNQYVGQTENEAIITIFNHLACGSGNHMRAFSRLLNRNDVVYTPQFISQDEYNTILSAENKPCGNRNGNGKGNGKGNGYGNGNCKNR